MTQASARRCFRSLVLVLAAWAALSPLGCSDDSDSDDGVGGSGGTGGSGGSSVQPFNGDCKTTRWADVSDECWSCMCTACEATLNACNEACMGVMTCGFDSLCMVNLGPEILCEIRCIGIECLQDQASQDAAGAVTGFDRCLIGAPKPSGFRVCEDVCSIPYPGDVCTRYP